MGGMLSKNDFPVKGRTVLITGGSRGMGRAAGRILAERGANVVIVARDQKRLLEAIKHIQEGAENSETQRFHHISADLSSPSESVRVIDEVATWNSGNPPDIVWCCAGTSHPGLFVDTPISAFREQMDGNYFSSLYMAHAAVNCWIKGAREGVDGPKETASNGKAAKPARHIIFTASFLALYGIAGYGAYSPSKAALRSLCETLSQEMNLYTAAHPNEAPIRAHTIFPATILTESYEAENLIKPDVTKMLEEDDKGQTPEVVALESIKGLERGLELITTDLMTGLVKGSMLGGSTRGGPGRILIDWFLAWLMGIVMVIVRSDMDKKVRDWGRKFGSASKTTASKQT
ncbi:hypothetical protein PFICI_05527 [Pestalotiopsis fici W106-1]|uniref:3-dehydrosphinganine reductase n=1 Tax=Pestalotiopsis fici (strain W106-1 / CGMCC3.15140) TaxID=1229662 RepID=W3XEN1_PESFW|nr:uncharacterized protein PFICI_05527 [Pestalotiopsis fici W106-1]ETS83651.1 hypothetical protein PFICI_05527 [Pestalotiopsis fici W106-1]